MSADLRLPGPIDLGELADAEPVTDFKLRPYQAEAVKKSRRYFYEFLRGIPRGVPSATIRCRGISSFRSSGV